MPSRPIDTRCTSAKRSACEATPRPSTSCWRTRFSRRVIEAQAEWEVRAALPIIEEEKMVPEGFAALTLLRESLRRRKLDRQALRNLHGYFRE